MYRNNYQGQTVSTTELEKTWILGAELVCPLQQGRANATSSAQAHFAARHNMPVLFSSILSQPSLCCKARNRRITSTPLFLREAEGLACVWWNLLLPTSLQAPVILGHKVVQTGAASLPHNSSFLPFFHSLTTILQTEGGEEVAIWRAKYQSSVSHKFLLNQKLL